MGLLETWVAFITNNNKRNFGPIARRKSCHQQDGVYYGSPVYLSFLILSSLLLSVSTEMVCQKGVQNFAGVTYPPGDIILQEGDPLDVYCSVNLTHPKAKGYNASHLEFDVRKHNIPKELIHTEIVNETTIHMRIKNMNASIVYVDCVVRKEDGSSVQVCQNHVEVGYLPQNVEDFQCRAWNWTKLVCSWKRPENPIPVNYNISFITSKRYEYFCPKIWNHFNGTYSCEWNKNDPPYKPNEKRYVFKINGTNALNRSGVIWYKQVDHYSIVIPEPPKIRPITVQSPNRLFVNWTFKNFEHFPPGLEHNLTVCSEYGECSQTIFTTETSVSHVTREIQVPHAFSNYTVTVRMRSQTAEKTEEFWSAPVSAMARTLAKAPDAAPHTEIGSFEIYRNKLQHRNIYVYWQSTEPSKRNGPQFHYQFNLFENGLRTEVQPQEVNSAYAKYVNLSDSAEYRVDIYAANEVGRSPEKSTVVIPSSEKAPEEPQRVSRLEYSNGTIVVSWAPPLKHENIVSYTVFRCNHNRPRPHQCNGLLKWDVVPADKENRVVYHNLSNHNGEVIQFAVAANTEEYSSGMMWASCSLLPDKVPDKLKPVDVVEAKEDQLRIEWELDCSYQDGIIDGFRIAYCQVDEGQKCVDGEKSAFIQDGEQKTYTLKDLQPYSKYKIAISVQTKAGESQQSTPRIWSTSEAAPTDPPTLSAVDIRNTSIVVRIKPPAIPNGVLRRYEIRLRSNSTETDRIPRRIIDVNGLETAEEVEQELQGLESNTLYYIRVSACTIKCSVESEPVLVTTKTGATNMKKAPVLRYGSGNLKIAWRTPNHLGGEITRFEVMVKRNGKEVNESSITYLDGIADYKKDVRMQCDSNTNLTAKVRAVTVLENGSELFGDWSEEGSFACVGTLGYVVWITVGVVLFFVVVLLGFAGQKCWNYYMNCRYGIEPKLPPGLEKELYPRNPVPVRRGDSMDDIPPYGKDNLSSSSPLKYISSTNIDEERGILTPSQNIQEDKNSIGDRRMSPSALNPLLSDRSMVTDDEEYTLTSTPIKPEGLNMVEEPYKKLGTLGNGHIVMPDNVHLKGICNGDVISDHPLTGCNEPVTPLQQQQEPQQNDYTAQSLDEVFSSTSASTASSLSETRSPEKIHATSRIVPDVLTTNNPSSYVRWTQLLPDFKNEAISNRQSSSYCQVGII